MTIELTAPSTPKRDARALDDDWVPVCRLDDLPVERGAAALVDARQVALFRLVEGEVVAVCQRDPYSGAYVIARGIVGTHAGRPTVASPMYKHVFDLRSGECVEAHGRERQSLRVYPTRVVDGVVLIERGAA